MPREPKRRIEKSRSTPIGKSRRGHQRICSLDTPWTRSTKTRLDLSAIKSRSANPRQNRYKPISTAETELSRPTSNWAFTFTPPPVAVSVPKPVAQTQLTTFKDSLRIEQLNALFPPLLPTGHDKPEKDEKQELRFLGNCEQLVNHFESFKAKSGFEDARSATTTGANFFPMTVHLSNHGFTQEYLERKKTMNPELRRKHSRFFPPMPALPLLKKETEHQVVQVRSTPNVILKKPTAKAPQMHTTVESIKDEDSMCPNACLCHAFDIFSQSEKPANKQAIGTDKKPSEGIVDCPNTCLCHAFRIFDQLESQTTEDIEQFESVDVDRDAEDDEWAVLFPETTVVEIRIREEVIATQASNKTQLWSCKRCGWRPTLQEDNTP